LENAFNDYLDRSNKVGEHNQLFEQGKVSYSLQICPDYGYLPTEEFNNFLNRFQMIKFNHVNFRFVQQRMLEDINFDVPIPPSLNYVNLGWITSVKNQALCGACWSFSATGVIEAQYYKKYGTSVKLSEQNLIDCNRDWTYG
jgi:C1A family cysteine protease